MFKIYNQNQRNIYIILFIRDLRIGLHAALCSTDQFVPPKARVDCPSVDRGF